jgi:hypothetical protein
MAAAGIHWAEYDCNKLESIHPQDSWEQSFGTDHIIAFAVGRISSSAALNVHNVRTRFTNGESGKEINDRRK